jgi:diacylglycerol kinase (ATP)
MTRVRVIVNPTSGREAAVASLADVNGVLRRAFGEVDIAMTASEGEHEREGARAAEDGCSHVITVGGDGTLNGVLNGIASRPGALAATTLGVIPAGTGNDFARTLGIPEDPVEAAERIAAGRIRPIDVGLVNDRCFLNTSAGGFVAETSIRVDSGMKTLAGRFAYLLGGAQALLEYEPVALVIRTHEATVLDVPTYTFVVSNTPYIGGGYQIAPDASPDDGLLDVCVIRATTVVGFLGILRRFAQGERLGEEEAVYLRTRAFDATADRPVWINTDGEPLQGTRFGYKLLSGAARFLC